MFRQILVHPADRPLRRIVWRSSPDQCISTFELNTVVYGTASAPYLVMCCLQQLASDFQSEFPVASTIISRDFYMDDLLTGFSSEDETISVCKDITSIFKIACFPLRKWTSNKSVVLEHIKDDSDSMSVIRLGDNECTKT